MYRTRVGAAVGWRSITARLIITVMLLAGVLLSNAGITVSQRAAGSTPFGFIDCNSNGVDDADDIADGFSQDCNENDVPDVCDVAFGGADDCNGNEIPDDCEFDCNDNGTPDDCDVPLGLSDDCNSNEVPDDCEFDCNENGIPDDCDIAGGASPDCNFNSLPDECDLALNLDDDCNGNGVPDRCDLSQTLADCNGNGLLDACDILEGVSNDCNENGTPDECEMIDCNGNGVLDDCDIAVGTSEDCDDDGVPDECLVSLYDENSLPLGPIGMGFPQTHTFVDPPEAGETVLVTFRAIGDFGSIVEFLDVTLNETAIGSVFVDNASDCPPLDQADTILLDAEFFNILIDGGDATFAMFPSAAVDPDPVLCETHVQVDLKYHVIVEGDMNGNGIPDVCEDNCPGDLNADGLVNSDDFIQVLLAWGLESAPGDITGDGQVDTDDFLAILCAWGSCP